MISVLNSRLSAFFLMVVLVLNVGTVLLSQDSPPLDP
jgi:hypothetical protein